VKPLPIRLRLTVWYCTLFATAALLLSLTSWWMLRYTIDTTLQQDLQERADDVRVELEQLGPHFTPNQAQASFDAIYRLRDDGKWLQIADQTGQWVYRSSRMVARNMAPIPPRTLSFSGVAGEFVQGGHPVLTFTSPVVVNGIRYTVMTGISMKRSTTLLRRFGMGLLFLTPAVVLIAALAGHLVSRKALSPVAHIVREARRISDRNLETRLPISPADDELSDLSVTLNSMLARIDAGFRSVRDFTSNASHELRTPLARLRTEVEIALLRPRKAAEYRDSLEHLHSTAIDMSNVIDSLLTIARAEAGTEILRLTAVDLSSLATLLFEEWSPIAARLDIRFLVTGLDIGDQPVYVLGDRLSLIRLIRVLLDNAFKFTPSGGAVSIFADLHQDSVAITVEDNGPGIDPRHHAEIFDRFFRVQNDAATQSSGAGLGLSLAAWIAEQHETEIIVDSALSQGARFRITLAKTYPNGLIDSQAVHDQAMAHSSVST
jgi:signal transduction histidine kinase